MTGRNFAWLMAGCAGGSVGGWWLAEVLSLAGALAVAAVSLFLLLILWRKKNPEPEEVRRSHEAVTREEEGEI